MRVTSTALLLLCLLGQSQPLAQGRSPAASAAPVSREATLPSQGFVLRDAIEREAGHQALAQGGGSQSAFRNRPWIQRHPVLLGALAGAGAGAVSAIPRWNELYCATGGDEDCFFHGGQGVFVGAGIGAGIGSVVGIVVGRE